MIVSLKWPRWTPAREPVERRTLLWRCFWGGVVATFVFWVVVGVAFLEASMRDLVQTGNRVERGMAYWPGAED